MSLFKIRDNLDHRFAGENLSAYLDEELNARETKRIRRHLQECALCRHELATLRATRRAMRELPLKAVPRSFVLPASAQRQQVAFRRWNMAYSTMRGLAVAVSLVLVLLFSGDVLMGMGVTSMFGLMQPKSAPVMLESAPMEAEREVVVEKEVEKAPGERQLLAPAGKGGEGEPERKVIKAAEMPVQEAASPEAMALAQATQSPSAKVLRAQKAAPAPQAVGEGAIPKPTQASAHVSATPVEQPLKVARGADQAATATALPKIVVKPATEEGEATRDATSADWEQPEIVQPASGVVESPLLRLWGAVRLLAGLLLGILLMLLAGLIIVGQKRHI